MSQSHQGEWVIQIHEKSGNNRFIWFSSKEPSVVECIGLVWHLFKIEFLRLTAKSIKVNMSRNTATIRWKYHPGWLSSFSNRAPPESKSFWNNFSWQILKTFFHCSVRHEKLHGSSTNFKWDNWDWDDINDEMRRRIGHCGNNLP